MNWDLNDLYRGFEDPAFERDMEELKNGAERARVTLEGAGHEDERGVVAGLIERMKGLSALNARLGAMLYLTLACDARHEAALSYYDRYRKLGVELTQLDSAAARYLGEVTDIEELITSDPLLMEHAYLLREWKKRAAHTIDPALEGVVLQMQLTGGDAWAKLRDQLDATHEVRYTFDGQERTLTLSEVRGMAYSPDPAVRKAAYEAEIAAYPLIEQPMAACLSGIKGEALTLMPLKHYDCVLDQSIDQARITRPILNALIGAMEKSLSAFRRYLRAKAKALGHEGGLPFYDLFAPLGSAAGEYTLDQARGILIDALGGFSPDMGRMIDQAFEDKWIDAYPRPGKQGGAFCLGAYPVGHSYVLANFDGSLNSVSTLAHELGHAYHDRQLFKNSILNAEAPMTLAETASIFNETLLSSVLIKRAGREEKLLLLDQELTEATQTVVDILSRYYFESEVILRRADHALSPSELCRIMLEAQQKTYGEGLSLYHPYMWACKCHYYGADLHFYNFPYAFGLLFSKGIYALYQKEGAGFVDRYDQLLRDTALGDAAQAAASVGIDLSDEGFWQGSLKLIERGVEQLEALL